MKMNIVVKYYIFFVKNICLKMFDIYIYLFYILNSIRINYIYKLILVYILTF